MIELCVVGRATRSACRCVAACSRLPKISWGCFSEEVFGKPYTSYTATPEAFQRGRSVRLPRWYVTVGLKFSYLERLCEAVEV
jgi:hypothetical protein